MLQVDIWTLPVTIIAIMLICVCCGIAVSKGSPKAKLDDARTLPYYLREQMEKTAPMKEQAAYYTPATMKREKRVIPGVSRSISSVPPHERRETRNVKALRGGEFIGNRMRFKVKVLNETLYTITDVRVFLISYPSKALKIDSEDDDVFFPKIEPNGFRSPAFDFLPTQDCVKGEIIAGVSYIDERGIAHTLTTKPFIIRSVCDLLIPDKISPDEFELKLKKHECGEIVVKVQEWTAAEMFEKSLRIIEDANFYEVESNSDDHDGIFSATISGQAKGKYTGKSIGVKILMSGPVNQKGASCTIQVTGEDQAMILPAIDDLRERLNAWLCPMCGSPLTKDNVEDLKAGRVIVCPFCNVSIGR
ncbi:MAG: hypothetical protein JW779_02585 [Candidatus Thorarchaeota archaeon]|nr:hypothetical protein [Candidatus Thorarchaeota archaeon]